MLPAYLNALSGFTLYAGGGVLPHFILHASSLLFVHNQIIWVVVVPLSAAILGGLSSSLFLLLIVSSLVR